MDKVYDMTLSEFKLREYAYVREQQWEWAKYRLVGFMSIRAFNIYPKDIPKKLEDIINLSFVDGGGVGSNLTDRQIEAMQKAQDDYFKQLKLKEIGN